MPTTKTMPLLKILISLPSGLGNWTHHVGFRVVPPYCDV